MNKEIFEKISKISSDLEDISYELYHHCFEKGDNVALLDRAKVVTAMEILDNLIILYEDENGDFNDR